ncbi:hypothetical protein NMY22_g12837 [Coprinellus aureogranulatus]|nr:hypothetical protein NMY22_g12837 [Coprinellus aureogranulatus]
MSAQEPKRASAAKDEQLHIRPFEARDADQVRNLIVSGLRDDDGSSLQVGMKAILWEPICGVSYVVGVLGLVLLLKSRGDLFKVTGGFALCAFPILWVRLVRSRLSLIWDAYIREFLEEGDMVDPGRFYARDKPKGDDDGGVSAFWVVEATEGQTKRVVGCIGLDSRGQADKSCSELRRLSVSDKYRRRGIALMLIRTLYSYAREKRLKKLTLSTTTYQVTALDMYKRLGWVEVGKFRLAGPWIRDFHLHTLDLKL